MTYREQLLEQEVLALRMELVVTRASAYREIDALKAQNAAMLVCGRSLEESNSNLQKMLLMAEASLVQASAVASSMAAEGRALGNRLGRAEAEARQTDAQLSTVLAMAKAKVNVSSFPLAQWVATVCHEVQVGLDLGQLGQQLATGGRDAAAMKEMVSAVKTEVMNRVRAAPLSTKDVFSFLGSLPPVPAIPGSSLSGNLPLAAAAVPASILAPAAVPAPAVVPAPIAVPTSMPAPMLPARPTTSASGASYHTVATLNPAGRVVPGNTRRRTS